MYLHCASDPLMSNLYTVDIYIKIIVVTNIAHDLIGKSRCSKSHIITFVNSHITLALKLCIFLCLKHNTMLMYTLFLCDLEGLLHGRRGTLAFGILYAHGLLNDIETS